MFLKISDGTKRWTGSMLIGAKRSFFIDWFVPVDDRLSGLDNGIVESHKPTLALVESSMLRDDGTLREKS